ncbi:single-strand selective monofunctional uracil DNA glycosylase isoform X1 [Lethenteron reissneri]|uniref:single-strand selective monofunctional uracil DNA glycosylase isoform X1 n=2 Tax=Lethenteron reissneri TaxID=7753 RepID=UPI002AB60044|nr:single-strand selective monofunctional uracil DNA glycosylase isoform X1 [Lethenteron reissneri]
MSPFYVVATMLPTKRRQQQQQPQHPEPRNKRACGTIDDDDDDGNSADVAISPEAASAASAQEVACDAASTGGELSPERLVPTAFACSFLEVEATLNGVLSRLSFGDPVRYVYNPTEYAAETHRRFVAAYCRGPKDVLFLGMNPGPFGMSQTGVPFGEVSVVRDWLRITGEVRQPPHVHPKRPVLGLACPKSEVSGARFWGFFRSLCGPPDAFFRRCYVHNYCPLAFLAESGKNVTPPELPAAQRRALVQACDAALCLAVRALGVRVVVGLGRYAERRARDALEAGGMGPAEVRVAFLMHPSPVNPRANRGWDAVARRTMQEIGILELLTTEDGEIGQCAG